MLVRNPRAITTLIRNRLYTHTPLEEKLLWFHEKGITVTPQDENFMLKTDRRGHSSELSALCNNIVFGAGQLLAFHGFEVEELSLNEARSLPRFLWNEDTILYEALDGRDIYMYWNPEEKDWIFGTDRKAKTTYDRIIKPKMYNIMAAEEGYTYCFKLVEKGEKSGVFLERVYNNRTLHEEPLKRLISFSHRFDIPVIKSYYFEGFETIEKDDLPLYAVDASKNRIKIVEL